MRRKKHKHTRRAVSFYRINYGMHEPYKVLLDGNFIHATRTCGMDDLAKHLPNLLGGRTKLFVTPCVMAELKALGPDFRDTMAVARKIQLHYCSHHHAKPASAAAGAGAARGAEERLAKRSRAGAGTSGGEGADKAEGVEQLPLPPCPAAADCIRECVGEKNAQHWWVATQDRALRSTLASTPGTPLLFASLNGLHLESPDEMAKAVAADREAASGAIPAHERASATLADLEAITPKLRTSAKFRHNNAKGANPLASKKKKARAVVGRSAAKAVSGGGGGGGGGGAGGDGGGEGAGGGVGEGGRKRKRQRKGGPAGDAGGDE